MSEGRESAAIDGQPGEQHPRPHRRPWRTPHVILADAAYTELSNNLPDDGPSSVS